MELKRAITEYLSQQLNDIYQEKYGSSAERPFVFECDFTRDDGNFVLFDENGRIILDQYLNYIKYIPCSVYSLIADMIEIPNLQILDALVPIEMFVDNQRLDMAMSILALFQQRINGVPFTLTADYQGTTQTCNIIMNFNLPTDDDFQIIDGINGKVIDFQISASITFDVIFGNSIQYELSIDGGNTFEPLIKTNPSENFVISPYTDQIINDDRTKDLPKVATWSLSLSAIVKQNSILETLIPYASVPYSFLDTGYIFDKTYLKTNFLFKDKLVADKYLSTFANETPLIPHSKIDLEQIRTLISPNSVADGEATFSLGNNLTLRFVKTNNVLWFRIFEGANVRNTLLVDTSWSTSFEDDYFIFSQENKTLTLKKQTNIRQVSNTYTLDNPNTFGLVVAPNYFIKPVLITQITPDFSNADIASVQLEFKDRVEIE